MVTTTPVTIEQAAALLGVSASTIRRRIRAGTLQVTETRRPQGVVWLVHLPADVRPASETATVDTAPVTTAPTAQSAPAEAMVSLIQTTIATVLGPLVAELAASRETIAAHGETISHQAETIGRLRAELDAAKSTLTVSTGAEPSAAPSDVGIGRLWTSARWGWTGAAILAVMALATGLAAVLR